jgi:dihydropteroate synthase
MGVRSAGVLRLGRRRFEPRQLLVMAVAPGPAAEGGQASSAAEGGQASSAAEGGQWVHAAAAAGADMVEVSGVPEVSVAPFVATVRDAYPELVIAVRTGSGEVAREACTAGADLLSGGLSGPLLDVAAEFGVGVVGSLTGAALRGGRCWFRSWARTWLGIWRGRRFSGGWGHGCSGFSGCGRPGAH